MQTLIYFSIGMISLILFVISLMFVVGSIYSSKIIKRHKRFLANLSTIKEGITIFHWKDEIYLPLDNARYAFSDGILCLEFNSIPFPEDHPYSVFKDMQVQIWGLQVKAKGVDELTNEDFLLYMSSSQPWNGYTNLYIHEHYTSKFTNITFTDTHVFVTGKTDDINNYGPDAKDNLFCVLCKLGTLTESENIYNKYEWMKESV